MQVGQLVNGRWTIPPAKLAVRPSAPGIARETASPFALPPSLSTSTNLPTSRRVIGAPFVHSLEAAYADTRDVNIFSCFKVGELIGRSAPSRLSRCEAWTDKQPEARRALRISQGGLARLRREEQSETRRKIEKSAGLVSPGWKDFARRRKSAGGMEAGVLGLASRGK